MSNKKIPLEKVYIGKSRDFKNFQECFFSKDKNNLDIYIDEGEYKDFIDLSYAKNINITGTGKVIIYSNKEFIIYTKYSENINLQNLILDGRNFTEFGIKDEYSSELVIKNCLIINNKIGIQYDKYSKFFLENNSILKNEKVNLLSLDKNSEINLKKNIISLSKIGIRSIFLSVIKAEKNLCFSNKVNLDNFVNSNFLEVEQEFESVENNDFRLKDKRFKDIGASEELLLSYANLKKNNENEKQAVNNTKLSIFLNMSLTDLINDYKSFISERFKNQDNINFIENNQQIKNSDLLLIVNSFDEHEDSEKVFEFISKSIRLKKDFYIFYPSEKYTVSAGKINLNKMNSFQNTKNKIIENYPDKILYYDNLEELSQLFYEKSHLSPSRIKINSLHLKNISNFNDLKVNFESKNVCLIGANGTGKTTLLRTIALALIGHFHKNINTNQLKNLLRINGLDNHIIKRNSGEITLSYEIDNQKFENTLKFEPTSDNDIEISISKNTKFEVLNGDIIKSLVIGFTQNRGISKLSQDDLKQRNELQLPHINDLITLINNNGDNRLKVFSEWIINLDAKANKLENEALKNKKENFYIKERNIIEKIFKIISEITKEEIVFKEVLNNNDVWIITKNNPEGISLELVSQGFQSIIGWIGFFLQRMAESYPDSKDFTKEPAICFVDEIDIYIHPKWQRNILVVLEKYFTNTQFIITTHSPIVISNLNNENNIVYLIGNNSTDRVYSYGKDINSILFEAYGVNERPYEIQEELDELFILIEDEKIENAKILLNKLREKIIGNDPDILKAEIMISVLEE